MIVAFITKSYAEEVDKAPSGVELHEVHVNHTSGTILVLPGKNAGEITGNSSVNYNTHPVPVRGVDGLNPNTTTIIHGSGGGSGGGSGSFTNKNNLIKEQQK